MKKMDNPPTEKLTRWGPHHPTEILGRLGGTLTRKKFARVARAKFFGDPPTEKLLRLGGDPLSILEKIDLPPYRKKFSVGVSTP